jgi:serine/threonine protein kinase/tetratricopeptide (TPR) repeat protein
MIKKMVSHYKILEKIGSGGMGVVYKAKDTKLDRLVALKFLPEQFSFNEEEKKRFIQEAKVAAALDHPNICTVHEISETANGQLFIVMAYYEGKTLQFNISQGSLPITDAIDIIIQVADGLNKAHKKDIVHRDIKSANIIITNDGVVKILDFGLAKLKGATKLTKKGTTLGTVAYMSPEQTSGETVDHRSDIWSLGVLLYEMVTGKVPFKGEYQQAIMYSIMNEDPEPVTALRTDVPMELERIINKTLSRDPKERYQSADELIVDLKVQSKKLILTPTINIPVKKRPRSSIAVLPFRDMSPQKDQDYFCEGIAEEIITSLTHIEKLRVIARTSAFVFKEKNVDAREIGKKLDVETLLEGSVRKAGNRLRITAQLINVADGSHLWSERYDREMKDIFAIQDEITLSIVDILKIKLLGKEKAAVVKSHTVNQEAHNCYLKGRYFWNRREKVGYWMAFEHFQQAIEIDPLFALPYVGIADTYILLGQFGILPPKEAFIKANLAVKKALDIDNSIGEAHTSLAWISAAFDWDWKMARHEFKQAITLNPTHATTHEWYALYLASLGYFDEALSEAFKALKLDPVSLMINSSIAVVYYMARKFEQAIFHYKKTIELDPNFLLPNVWLGDLYAVIGRKEEARETLNKALSLAGDMTFALGYIGQGYGINGQRTEAQAILDRLDELSMNVYVSPIYKMMVHTGLGNMDQAFKLLKEAYDVKEPSLIFLKTMSQYDDLRSNQKFNDILKKIGL